MTFVRKFIKWVSTHGTLSSLIVLVLVVVLGTVSYVRNRSAGTLTEPLKKGTVIDAVYGIGTVTANNVWRITPSVVTTVNNVWVKAGDVVKKGQKLIQNESVIWRAPFDGTVTSLSFKVGENTFNATPILTLVDMKDRYLLVSIEQQGALLVRIDQPVKLSFDTLRAQSYDGKVVAVYSSQTNYLARIDIASMPSQILPGMTADTAIEVERHENVLLASTAALEKGTEVWRKRGREFPKKIEIKVGIIDKDKFEIISGDLQGGDRLLIRKDLNK